jgi:hypothetical protein
LQAGTCTQVCFGAPTGDSTLKHEEYHTDIE